MKSPFVCLLAAVIAVFTLSLFAQGIYESIGPEGGYIQDMVKDNQGRILAATFLGGIYRSDDDGQSWVQIYTGSDIIDVRSLAVNSSGHIFAGSDGLGLFRSTDDGLTWERLNNALFTRTITTLLIKSSGEIFAGTFSSLYYSSDNGQTFTLRDNGITTSSIYRIKSNSNEDLFTGTYNEGFFRSTDNGSNWIAINNGISFSGGIATGIDFNSNGDAFATVGNDIYLSTNNGDDWTDLNAPTAGYSDIIISSSGPAFASATSINQALGGGVFRSTDNGTNWTQLSGLPNVPLRVLIAPETTLNNPSAQSILTGSYGLGTYRSPDLGDNWLHSKAGMKNTHITTMIDDASGGWWAATQFAGVYYLPPSSTSWENKSVGLPYDWYISLGYNENTGTVFTSNNFESYKYVNNAWVDLNIGATVAWGDLSTGEMLAGNYNIVRISSDDFQTNTPYFLDGSPITKIETTDLNQIYVSTRNLSGTGGVFFSEANPISFTPINNGLTSTDVIDLRELGDPTSSSSCDQSLACLDKVGNTFVYDFTNTQWSNYNLNGTTEAKGLFDVDDGTGEHTLGAFNIWQFFNLTELACIWVPMSAIFQSYEIHVAEQDEDGDSPTGQPIVMAGTWGGGIYRVPLVSDVEQITSDIPKEFHLEQNYPNPFNPSTTIQFSIPEQSFVKLEVFNALGEKVSTLVSEELSAGNYKYEVNVGAIRQRRSDLSLPSGIYYYKLSAGEFTETKKLVFLK